MDKADVDEEGDEAWQYVRNMLDYDDRRAQDSKATSNPIGEDRELPETHESAETAQPNWSHIIRTVALHNEWLRDSNTGERAYLTGMILAGIDLSPPAINPSRRRS